MEFEKYKNWKDYHWREYERDTIYKRHADKVKDWVKGKNILDIGAGDGLITSLIGAKGIDVDEYGIKEAGKHGIVVEKRSAYNLAGEYDAVFMGDVMEHLERPEEALKEIKKVLKGHLYLVVPKKHKELPKEHFQEWEPQEIVEFVEKQGFKTLSLEQANERIYIKFSI